MQTLPPSSQQPLSLGKKIAVAFTVLLLAGIVVGSLWFLRLTVPPNISIPTPTMPSPNALDFYIAAGKQFRDSKKVGYAQQHRHSGTNTDDHVYSLNEQEEFVSENAVTLQTLRKGLSCAYLSPPFRSINDVGHYWATERSLARLLALDVQVKAARGDAAGAVNAGLDAVQMGEQLPHGAVLIGQLVGIACQSIGRDRVWPEVNSLTAVQAQAAANRLEPIEASPVSLAETWQQEEWFGQAAILEQFQHGQARGLAQFAKNAILRHYTDFMNECIAEARMPYAARPPAPTIPDDPWCVEMCPVFAPDSIRYADNETQNSLLMVTLALRAYHAQHGGYPPSLQALVPQYLTAIPADPFARSGPLRYQFQGGRYVLYSIGPDGKDDGGKPIFDPSKPAPISGERDMRFIVWPNSAGDDVAGVNWV